MDVLKRSEFCGVSSQLLGGIPLGTIFRGAIGGYPPHVWIKTYEAGGNAVCIGEPGERMATGVTCSGDKHAEVVGYEVLNATLVIDD